MGRGTEHRLGADLKALREQRRMTQGALATKVGISREYLARLESGVQEPSLVMLRRIAAALRVRLVVRLGGLGRSA
jgi:transcriptional regulator with XRE-family HTH domain